MSIDEGILEKKDWDHLLRFIKNGKCTPFIGAGASHPYLPLGREIASDWANSYNYPLKDSYDLAKVSQFMAIDNYEMFPKHCIADAFQNKNQPDFSKKEEPHGILADLNLPIYITTNYDNFMFDALKSRKKLPERDFCRWNDIDKILKIKPILGSSYTPSCDRPLVYHLHGYLEIPESMVLTESDYLDFMVRLNDIEHSILPPETVIALTTNALLFVGYSLADWNFRVLFRSLFSALSNFTNLIIAVQLPPEDVKNQNDAIRYLGNYFKWILSRPTNIKVRVYWGGSDQFAKELRERWEAATSVK